MVGRLEPSPSVEDDPSTASDALSLHTIADQADAYAAQEQEDADFALALALEEQETARFAHAERHRVTQNNEADENQAPDQTEAFPPYRDDPDAVDDDEPPPYRDDPNVESDQNADPEAATETTPRKNRVVGILQKLFKTWLCCVLFSSAITIIIVVVVILLAFAYGTKQTPKERAWHASQSQDGKLVLPRLYPKLEVGASNECKDAWENYGAQLDCHRMILSTAWDNGDPAEVNSTNADPFYHSAAVCSLRCRSSIVRLGNPFPKACILRKDRFDFNNYGKDGKAYFEKHELEEGPGHVAISLLARYDSLCRSTPRQREKTEWKTCSADLWMKWGIIGGQNEAHMNGLKEFLERTSEKKTIPAETRTVTALNSNNVERAYIISLPSRDVGPGSEETDCGFCTLDWLERKMRSFEYGQMLDPESGEPLGLLEFYKKMEGVVQRCKGYKHHNALGRTRQKWETLGWWCNGKPCHRDRPSISKEVKHILHGWDKEELPTNFRKLMDEGKIPKAMQALVFGIKDLPCGMSFDKYIAIRDIIPNEYVISRLCGDKCRNAIERLQARIRIEFPDAAKDPKYGRYFDAWNEGIQFYNKVCLTSQPKTIFKGPQYLCAPGYASVDRPQWIFESQPPSRPRILSTFSAAIDELDAKLPRYPSRLTSPEQMQIQAKVLAGSLCNTCAGGLFIGHERQWKKTVGEFLGDPSINGTEYVQAAKKGWLVCGRMYGLTFSRTDQKKLWQMTGLDRYD